MSAAFLVRHDDYILPDVTEDAIERDGFRLGIGSDRTLGIGFQQLERLNHWLMGRIIGAKG